MPSTEGVVGGRLYLVATPIGNLSDITLRALETLRRVPCIAAEDTRRTRALLTHFSIRSKDLVSCPAHAKPQVLQRLVSRMTRGDEVALVTDAGMPGVSDPGAALVRLARASDVPITPIPGPSALTAAIAVSGLVDGPFHFFGFLPRQGKKRREKLDAVASSTDPSIVFEAPNRVTKTLSELASLAPERDALICRELTKVHEELIRGTLAELAERPSPRGEVTLVIGAATDAPPAPASDDAVSNHRIEEMLRAGASPRGVVEVLAETSDEPRRSLYRRVTEVAGRLEGGEG